MALKAGAVPKLPDLACVGMVSKVGEAYLSEKGVYHVLPLEIKAKFGGRDAVFFVVFEPRWFEKSFDPSELLAEEKKGVKYGMYRRTVANKVFDGEGKPIKNAAPSVLQSLIGDKFDEFAAEFDKMDGVTEKDIELVVREYVNGVDVGYVLQQRTEESGELTEQYNIGRLFPVTGVLSDNALNYIREQAKNEKRKRGPLIVTWDE